MAIVDVDGHRELLDRLEHYFDAVPRSAARTEQFGPLTLFLNDRAGHPFYARPALGADQPVTADDVTRVRERQRELGAPESFEWVAETTPTMRSAAEQTGLTVQEHPLMALDLDTPLPSPGTARVLTEDDPILASALAVPHLAFGEPGTDIGTADTAALDKLVPDQSAEVERIGARIHAGLTVVAAAIEDGRALSSGRHNPVGDISEIVAVGTLPAARRRGLALAVTTALAADARSRGISTVFLSATDDPVARIYARAGFRRVGTALIAEPA